MTYLNMNHTKEAEAFSIDNVEMKAEISAKAKILPDQYQGKQGM